MQAVTNNLERLILQGKATYNVYNFAFGMFGAIPITPGNTAIITNITYYPFLNPINIFREGEAEGTWRNLLSYIEYQLKIEGKKSINFYQFRNEFNITFLNSTVNINLDDNIDLEFLQNYCLFGTKHPIQIPTYQVCEEFIKLTVSRNALVNYINPASGYVNNANANESIAPQGVEDINVLLKAQMFDHSANQQDYFPPNIENSGLPITFNRSLENYSQDLHFADADGFLNSQLSPLQDMIGTNPSLPHVNPYGSYPLISLGYVLINKNAFDELMNN